MILWCKLELAKWLMKGWTCRKEEKKNQWRKERMRYQIHQISSIQRRYFMFLHPQSLSKTAIVRLVCVSESLGKFVKAQGRVREFALLASSQVLLVLLVWGPHFQNHQNNWRSCWTFPSLHSRCLFRVNISLDFINLGSFETSFSVSHLVLLTWWNLVCFQPEETSWEKTGCKGCGEKDEAIKRGNSKSSIIIIHSNF